MKKMLVGFTAAIFVLLFFSYTAMAAPISIRNSTGFTIFYAYISDSGTTSWEEDILGSDVLSNGATLRVNVRGSYRQFDLKVVDEDGDEMLWYNFPGNVTQITIFGDGRAEYQ